MGQVEIVDSRLDLGVSHWWIEVREVILVSLVGFIILQKDTPERDRAGGAKIRGKLGGWIAFKS